MEQEILTPTQQSVLRMFVAEEKLAACYLSGGTALAAYYDHHRYSDDLDFFSTTATASTVVHEFVARLTQQLGVNAARFERVHDRSFFSSIDRWRRIKN
jgi:hypothetical protein